LWLLTCFTQANFLTFNFARIASNVTGFTQIATQRLVIFHQRTGQAVTDSTRLTETTATSNGNVNVKLFYQTNQFQWLTHYHARNWTTEILVQRTIIYDNGACTSGDEHARGRGFATASAVKLC